MKEIRKGLITTHSAFWVKNNQATEGLFNMVSVVSYPMNLVERNVSVPLVYWYM